MLSIIIPTLNEEKYLPKLLESIKEQDFYDYEVIISDAGSKDRTLDIANRFGCVIAKGGLPAKGKNSGARIAKGDILLFSDADTIFPKGFLKSNISEFEKRNLSVAGVFVRTFEPGIFYRFLFDFFYNFPALVSEKFIIHTAVAIFAEKKVFLLLNGFDEDIKIAEDHDLGRRARKFGKTGILKSAPILTSLRRYEKDGWIRTYFKYLFTELHMIFIGPVKSDIIKYEFNHYSKDLPKNPKRVYNKLLNK